MKPVDSTSHPMTRTLLTPRWMITTLLVIAAVAGMVRLGLWQLDRLEERRAFNTRVAEQIDADQLSLNEALGTEEVAPEQLLQMEYRQVMVSGVFDPQNEIILRNQVYENMPGYHLVTPMRLDGTDIVVLVDRGFIPMEQADPTARAQYARTGSVTVSGIVRLPHVPRFFGAPDPTLAPGETRLDAWNAFDMESIQAQLPYEVLPVYVQAAPEGSGFPAAVLEQPELTEGSHLSYAAQWFIFAGLLAMGYPLFLRKQINPRQGKDTKRRKL